jgi:hypothetical protein
MRPSGPLAVAIAVALGVAAAAPVAFARAPKPGETPTVEDLLQEAKKAIESEAKKKEEAARDTTKDMIDAYRDGRTPLEEWAPLAEILNNAKDDKMGFYRQLVQQAFRERFSHERDTDPHVRQVRRDIANAILPLMKAPEKDDVGLRMIEGILYEWYRQQMLNLKFKATDKPGKRADAYTKMKKFLDKDN